MGRSSLPGSFTSAGQSQLLANIDITSNLPTDVPFTEVGTEPTLWRNCKKEIVKHSQWTGREHSHRKPALGQEFYRAFEPPLLILFPPSRLHCQTGGAELCALNEVLISFKVLIKHFSNQRKKVQKRGVGVQPYLTPLWCDGIEVSNQCSDFPTSGHRYLAGILICESLQALRAFHTHSRPPRGSGSHTQMMNLNH